MISSVLLLVGAVVAYLIYDVVSSMTSQIAAAKRTGLPYYVVPCCPLNRIGQLFAFIWMPLFKMLPREYWEQSVQTLQQDWQYHLNHKPFAKMGESFLIVSPRKIVLYTNEAEVIHQVTSRREAFPKPTEAYQILALYGDNVLTTEGAEWRMHRKVTSASFNEKNAALVFRESIGQTQGLIKQWLGADGKGNKTINTLGHDSMSLMLHIIGYIGFGLRLLWPGQKLPADTDPKLVKYSILEPPEGHTLNFVDSIAQTLENLIILLLVPRRLLDKLPFKKIKVAAESSNNFVKYMYEFLNDKIDDVKKGNKAEGMDLMGQLVRTSYGEKSANDSQTVLKDAEIVGDAFIMIVAGHETTANTLMFTLLELANNPTAQQLVQKDVDSIFGDADPQDWNYETSVNSLLASMVGAAMNETLRLMPPVVDIPKTVTPAQDQVLVVEGEQRTIPRGTHIGLCVAPVQRNPRYWPSNPSKITVDDNDMDDWVPERWYRNASTSSDNATAEGANTEEFGGFEGADTSAKLFRPPRGSYIPFSDGARSCLGRRMAQVELIATLSVICQKYSVELAVDEWASDSEVERMSKEEKAGLYKKAQDKSRATIKAATSLITLSLHGDQVIPIRLVKRSEERFVSWVS